MGYPVLVRPSYVLGGRAMVIAYDNATVERYMKQAVEYSQERPVLIDHFLEDATEFDVDCLSDGRRRLGLIGTVANNFIPIRYTATQRRHRSTMSARGRTGHGSPDPVIVAIFMA